MKAPAIRVLIARIQAKATEQCQAAYEAQQAANIAFRKEQVAVHQRINDTIADNANRDIAKYATFSIGKSEYGSPVWFRGTAEFDALCQQVRDANPLPKEPKTDIVQVSIASLNLSLKVPAKHEKEWEKFVYRCDSAFLEDDAKKIIEALEAIVG